MELTSQMPMGDSKRLVRTYRAGDKVNIRVENRTFGITVKSILRNTGADAYSKACDLVHVVIDHPERGRFRREINSTYKYCLDRDAKLFVGGRGRNSLSITIVLEAPTRYRFERPGDLS